MANTSHDFSPITSADRLESAINYVATNAFELGRTALGRELPIDTICFFACAGDEYEFLKAAVLGRGPESKFTHGATLYADTDFTVSDWTIKVFGVRLVEPDDPLRAHIVGYGDYPVTDYGQLIEETKTNPHVNQIVSGRGQPLIELRHPDFDVLGFAADAQEHQA